MGVPVDSHENSVQEQLYFLFAVCNYLLAMMIFLNVFIINFQRWAFDCQELYLQIQIWVVVSNIFYFHPYLGKWSNLTNIFQMGWNHQLEMLFVIVSWATFDRVLDIHVWEKVNPSWLNPMDALNPQEREALIGDSSLVSKGLMGGVIAERGLVVKQHP